MKTLGIIIGLVASLGASNVFAQDKVSLKQDLRTLAEQGINNEVKSLLADLNCEESNQCLSDILASNTISLPFEIKLAQTEKIREKVKVDSE